MIQEIFPSIYSNAYEPDAVPCPGDFAVYSDGGRVFLTEEPGFPAWPGGEGRFLFRIDGRGYFRASGEPQVPGKWYTRRELRSLGAGIPGFAGLCACQLAGWYDSNRFCGRCGEALVHDSKERMMRCPKCGAMNFPKISPAVIVAVTRGDQILLTRYKDRPGVNWALVAGFAEIGETIEDTVRREVLEETGVHVKDLQFYKSQPWCMSDSLLMGFWCRADVGEEPHPDGVELSIAQWVNRSDLELEFDNISLTNEMICRFKDGKEYQ